MKKNEVGKKQFSRQMAAILIIGGKLKLQSGDLHTPWVTSGKKLERSDNDFSSYRVNNIFFSILDPDL